MQRQREQMGSNNKKGGSQSRPGESKEMDTLTNASELRIFLQHFQHFAVELVSLKVFILHIGATAVEDTEIAF